MTKDGEMAQGEGSKLYPRMTSATRTWVLVPLCAALGCGGAAATGAPPDDAGFTAADAGAFVESGSPGPSKDSGNKNGEHDAGGGTTGIDSESPTMCLLEGVTCSADGGTPCCNGDCVNSACGGCLGEGEIGCSAEKACCAGLMCTPAGYCGTAACVWEGHACGGDGGAVCCNDDCNPSGICGPF
jgi:hypothetical protein